MDEIEYLTEKPYSGKNYSRIRKGHFRSKVKSHLIFYKISKNSYEIELIRILHQRIDIEDRLNDKLCHIIMNRGNARLKISSIEMKTIISKI